MPLQASRSLCKLLEDIGHRIMGQKFDRDKKSVRVVIRGVADEEG